MGYWNNDFQTVKGVEKYVTFENFIIIPNRQRSRSEVS